MNEETKQKSAIKRLGEQIVGVFGWVKNQWRENPLPSIVVVILLILLAWITWKTAQLGNLGFDGYYSDPESGYHRGKTYWDWMELLIIPIVLAIGAWWLNKSERENEREIAEKRREEDKEIARQNREQDREIADDRRNQATLEAYFDRMTELLLEKELRESGEGDEVRSIARTRTLAVLRSLDGNRKGDVVQFLYEADLIGPKLVVVLLNGAFLRGANLRGATLCEANLRGAYLRGACLRATDLSGSDLSGTDLRGAKLSWADLSEANLSSADLSGANLHRADMRGAKLYRASLSNADLNGTDLRGALVTDKQLAQAASLAGAILPDGTKVLDEETAEKQE